ncbi:hypothetical protein [[Clostridium] polysaccharolyticum]|uniref:Uncharacterized protein n=1 Tax=[Clostridium] polysaccharolyticum TaxID=29364 RepID=A0A1H9Y9L1_9FIRM|nr:hypothetical protein [[Clostridium] polysaccharolyticum]SES65524.1 hypothetical protein SAMN04487772_101232 [[Clostridium] polysaccharolyticum]
MIFYMATEQNKERLEFLAETYILNVNTYAYLGADDMLSLVKNELRNTEMEALIMDAGILEDSTLVNSEELLEVFKAFKLLYPESKIVVLTEKDMERETNEIFFSISFSSVSKELVDILSANAEEDSEKETLDMEQEIEKEREAEQESVGTDREIITKDRIKVSGGTPLLKMRVQQNNQEHKPKNIVKLSSACGDRNELNILKQQWSCNNLMVAVIGSERRTGTTTVAFKLSEWLSQSGAKVSYTEANAHFHLKLIAQKFRFRKENQYYVRKNINYYENTEFDKYNGRNFILLDLGSIQENTDWVIRILKEVADMIILTAGGKIYEQNALDKAVDILLFMEKPCAVIFNFLSEQDFLEQEERFHGNDIIMLNGEYEPDLLKPIDVSEIFECYKSS